MARIEAAFERLVTAYVAAGGTTDEFDPADEAQLDELRRLVAPLRLPNEIEWLWRQFQQHGVPGLIDTNSLASVDLAIGAAPFTSQSRALLTIGSGRATCYLELHDADGAGGGAVWSVEEFARDMHEVAPSLAALVDATAIAWERGIARLSNEHPFPWAAWDEERWERLKADVLPSGRVAGARPAGWLPRWLAAEGLVRADVAPRGATTTIGALHGLGSAWTETQTIRGVVSSMVSSLTASGPIVDDGTGDLAVYVPHAADPFRLLVWRQESELDVRPFPPGMEVEPPFDAAAFGALVVAVRDV